MFNGLKEISKQYRDKTIVERYKTIVNGIKEEKTSRSYKEAIIELMHEISKMAAFTIVCLSFLILLLIKTESKPLKQTIVPVEIIDPKTIEDLEEPEPPEFLDQLTEIPEISR